MRPPRSLQARLGVSLGVLLSVLWIGAASVTAVSLRAEMDAVFDSALQETAQRLLPLAVVDIVGREEAGATQRIAPLREHAEFFTYVVRDADGRILLRSHAADPAVFPAWDGPGFRRTVTHRLYGEDVLEGSLRITVAEPLERRAEVAREIQMGLGLPLLVVVPVALLTIALVIRANLAPVRRFRRRLAGRTAQDLSPVPTDDLPPEIAPVAVTLNGVLDRLKGAFDAERSFAANAAHELRTPLAGAIAQAQRIRSETAEPAAKARAADIETTLKRLARLSERLMQLARAEGGRLRANAPADLRPVLRIVSDEIARAVAPGRLVLDLPDAPVLSDLDPDALAILARNLIDNALRHGAQEGPVEIRLTRDGALSVANDGPVIPSDRLAQLTGRFVRDGAAEGSGLGLAIVAAIARRVDAPLQLRSPRPGSERGVAVTVSLPVAAT